MTNKIDYSFETIFDLIKLNECTLTEFEFWVACTENRLYNEGWDAGYKDCQLDNLNVK